MRNKIKQIVLDGICGCDTPDEITEKILEVLSESQSVSDNETKEKKFNPKYCNFWNTCEDHICNAGARCACDARIKF